MIKLKLAINMNEAESYNHRRKKKKINHPNPEDILLPELSNIVTNVHM